MENLFFIASKVFWYLLQPINLLFWLLLAGVVLLWTRYVRAGRRLIAGVLLVVLLLGVLPVGEWLATTLENRFPVARALPDDVTGVVVLSGAQNSRVSQSRGQPALGGDAERLTETLILMHRFPRARIFFTGFSGRLLPENPGAYETARRFFEAQRADVSRIRYEKHSRNTYENALYTQRLARPRAGEVWLLVTSAAHMPRSIGVFRQLGWKVTPVPVDFNTDGEYRFLPGWFSFHRVMQFNGAVREWIGLAAYYSSGKTSVLFPAEARAASVQAGDGQAKRTGVMTERKRDMTAEGGGRTERSK